MLAEKGRVQAGRMPQMPTALRGKARGRTHPPPNFYLVSDTAHHKLTFNCLALELARPGGMTVKQSKGMLWEASIHFLGEPPKPPVARGPAYSHTGRTSPTPASRSEESYCRLKRWRWPEALVELKE